jgi:hypothetical protein
VNAFLLQIVQHRQSLIVPDIFFIKELLIQIAGLHIVIIKNRESTDPLSAKRRSDVAHKTSGPDAEDFALRVNPLIKSRDLLLPILSPRNLPALKSDRDL